MVPTSERQYSELLLVTCKQTHTRRSVQILKACCDCGFYYLPNMSGRGRSKGKGDQLDKESKVSQTDDETVETDPKSEHDSGSKTGSTVKSRTGSKTGSKPRSRSADSRSSLGSDASRRLELEPVDECPPLNARR